MKKLQPRFGPWISLFLLLASLAFATAQDDVRLTEFMASNSSTLADEDGADSDWIELFNAGTNTVNLLNWSLTDSAGNLNKWQFPSTNIGPQRFLVVFASGKNRRIPGLPLHTNFKLGATGNYLALAKPDGTVVTEFAPAYPPQFSDVSYGFEIEQGFVTLIPTNAPLRAFVPLDASLGTSWMLLGFDDSAWLSGTNGAGFDLGTGNPGEDFAADVVLASQPSGFWRMNETSGTVASNIAPHAVNGVYHNVSLNLPGLRPPAFGGYETNNRAVQFNGASSYVSGLTNLVSNLGAFSLAGWIRPRTVPANRAGLFGQFGTIECGFLTSTQLQVWTAVGGSVTVTYPFPTNEWHQVTAVGDGSDLRIYLDGNLAATGGVATTNYGASNAAFNIGGGGIFDATGNWFSGQLDEVALWQRALSADEIQTQYGAAFSPTPAATYGNLIGTDLTSTMAGINSSAYLRYVFDFEDLSKVASLTLRLQYDDGFAAYLNGTLVASHNAPGDVFFNPLAWNAAATTSHADIQARQFESFDLSAQLGALVPGTNVLSIQGLNSSATNSDFLVRAELVTITNGDFNPEPGYFKNPTPGAPNGSITTDLGPVISRVGNTPALPVQPTVADSIIVTAKVARTYFPVTNVFLSWRVMFGPTNLYPMLDDGLHGDGAAGDGIYGATIPAGVATNGEMVRWIIWAGDSGGHTSRWPLFEDPAGSAEYEGTVLVDPSLSSLIPIFQIFIDPNSTNWIKPPAPGVPPQGVDSQTGGRISLYYDGDFYDNISMSLRGNTTATYPKNSHHINFNSNKPLRHPGPGGSVVHTSFLSETADPAYLRTYLSFWLLDLMGVPSPFDYPVRFHLNSQYYGLYFHNDTMGPEQLARLGYDPNGALYKAAGTVTPDYFSTGGFEKRTRLSEGRQDYDALAFGINEARPPGLRKTNLFDMLNVPEVVNYLATERFSQEGDDVWANMTLYRDSDNTKEWSIIPFDLNVSWGQLYCGDASGVYNVVIATNDTTKSHPLYGGSQVLSASSGNYNRIYDVIIATPETRQMLLRRQRTLMDRFLQPPGTSFDQGLIEQQISYMTNLLWGEMFLDRQKWGWPCTGVCGMYCWGNALPTDVHFGVPGLSTDFVGPRRRHFFVTHSITNGSKALGVGNNFKAGIPNSQPPNAFINVWSVEANPASGNQAQEYLCLTNPTPLALDISGWQLDGAVRFTFKPGTIMPSNSLLYVSPDVAAFRTRTTGPRGGQALFVVGPYQGQLSARGETIRITDDFGRLVTTNTYPGQPGPAQQYLRITELMYHPSGLLGNTNGPEEFEYVEFKNTSTNLSVDLTGVHFTNGLEFNFTGGSITSLGPGQSVLIVKDLTAFAARYGALPNIAGQYVGSLNNGGERLQLVDASGEQILDFTYDNKWYPITDGLGFSLVVVDELADPGAWNNRSNWRPSGTVDGSPGVTDPPPPLLPPVLVNEALSRTDTPPPTDTIELFNPTSAAADLSGWFLTDDFNTPKKFRFPAGTSLAAGAYLVVDESQFNPQPGVPPSFSLRADGDEVYLFSGDGATNLTGYVHGFSFGAAEEGVSFGRYVTSVGEEAFVSQTGVTLGGTNAGPKVGPVVITEVMYHPPDLGTNDDTLDEFIELVNITSNSVPLFDPIAPTNTWTVTGGVSFAFPTNQAVAAGESVLLVNFDPATNGPALPSFQAKYGVGASVRLFGPYGGKLNNGGDTISLRKPVLQQTGLVSAVLVEKVVYQNTAPWPAGADGFGLSLHRLVPSQYGNDPTNWVAAPPSAGVPWTGSGAVAPLITQQPLDQRGLAGTGLTLAVSASGSTPLAYQWRLNGVNLTGATNESLVLSALDSTQAGLYQVLVYNGAGSVVSTQAQVDVAYPLTILAQPQNQAARLSSLTNPAPTNASFSVAALGTAPITYQWSFNGNPLTGATNSVLTLSNLSLASQGSYQALVTDAIGSVPSDPASLVVLVTPVITQPLPAVVTAVQGSSLTYTLSIQGYPAPFNFQWRLGAKVLTNITQTSPSCSFTMGNLQPSNSGVYRVVITNLASPSNGVPANTTSTLTVLADTDGDGMPDVWETQFGLNPNDPGDAGLDADGDKMTNLQEYVAGTDPTNALSYLKVDRLSSSQGQSSVQFFAVSNKTYSVQYKESVNGGHWTKFIDLAARSSNHVETVADPYPATATRLYRLATPQLPDPTNPGPAILSSPQSVPAAVGDTVRFEVVAVGSGPLSYQWLFNDNGLGGEVSSNLVRQAVQFSDAGAYAVMVTDQKGTQTTDGAVLALRPLITGQPQSHPAAAGSDTTFNVTASGTGPLFYRWRHNGKAISGQTNAVLSLTAVGAADAGAYSVVVTVQTPIARLGSTSSNAVLTVTP